MASTSRQGSVWTDKGATLSDKSARKEFGLTQPEILAAVKAGKLQYRVNDMHGNPYLRLIRREVEALVREVHGKAHLKRKQYEAELARVNQSLRALRRQTAALEKEQAKLRQLLGQEADTPAS